MAGMILAKKFIFRISRSFPQTQSLFLRSSHSSTHKFFRATFSTAASAAKEKLADERTKDTGFRSVAEKALQNVKAGKNKDMAGKTDQQAEKIEKQRHWKKQAEKIKKLRHWKKQAEKIEKQRHWKKPPEGWHVLSTDGSVREDRAGIGGQIRDNNGSIVVAFAARIPIAPIHVIEIKAIVEGVKIAIITKGVTKLIINSDSMTAMILITNGRLKSTPREVRDELILLNSMKGSFSGFEVRHVCRKANRPADFLASLCKNETSLVFNSVNIPKKLKVLAAQDVTKYSTATTS